MCVCVLSVSMSLCVYVCICINSTLQVTVDDRQITELLIDNENVICELCHSEANEDLLLLCDGCDRG